MAKIKFGAEEAWLIKPATFMNRSGQAVGALAKFHKISPQQMLVIHDELDIPFKEIRLKLGGGDNGHNGLKSVTSNFTANYFRIRMGIGRPAGPQDPADFVLKPFSSTERSELEDFVARGALAIERLIEKGLEAAQQEFNK